MPRPGASTVFCPGCAGGAAPVVDPVTDPASPPVAVDVNGARGFWLEGEPHVVGFPDGRGNLQTESTRLARNVLVWDRDGVTFRLEGMASLDAALRVARSVR